MFHAPSSGTKQQSDSARTQAQQSPDSSSRAPFGYGPTRGQQFAHLHSTYGNQAVLRALSHAPAVLQPKLTVNKPGDEFEQEADRVADQVMRMTAPPPDHTQHLNPRALGTPAPTPSIQRKCSSCAAEEEKVQRKCAECEEEEKKTGLQRKESGAGPQFAPPSVQSVLNSPGRPLDAATRAFMGPRFGYDFSGVRVHDNAQAADSARAVNALAYAHGRNIVFNAGQYAPGTLAGRALLAHELTHVVQQDVSSHAHGILRKPAPPKFAQCEGSGDKLADLKVENARQQAICFVQVTIRDLKRAPSDPPAFSKAYGQALKVHFISPDDGERATIRDNYQSILNVLETATNIVCASSADEKAECQKQTDPVGFVISGKKTIILCPAFMDESITCRAILLIHEAAHTLGIGAKTPHPPNRGSAQYPGPEKGPPATETTALRMDNPDAYGYFAANIWRETDTLCLPTFKFDQVIEIHDTAPPQEKK